MRFQISIFNPLSGRSPCALSRQPAALRDEHRFMAKRLDDEVDRRELVESPEHLHELGHPAQANEAREPGGIRQLIVFKEIKITHR